MDRPHGYIHHLPTICQVNFRWQRCQLDVTIVNNLLHLHRQAPLLPMCSLL